MLNGSEMSKMFKITAVTEHPGLWQCLCEAKVAQLT